MAKFALLIVFTVTSTWNFDCTEAMGICKLVRLFPPKEVPDCSKNTENATGCLSKGLVHNVQPTLITANTSTYTSVSRVETGKIATDRESSQSHITTTTLCPSNMMYAACMVCQGTCQNPTRCEHSCLTNKTCVCPDGFLMEGEECVPQTECTCFKEGHGVIATNETFVNADCSERCDCGYDSFICNPSYRCSPNATCRTEDGVKQCYCNAGYEGDGETCTEVIFTDCNDVFDSGHMEDGVYSITPAGWPGPAFDVFCNVTMDGRAWTVFQRRIDGSTKFYRGWADYKAGFGNIEDEFWLGNEKLHYLTQQASYELLIEFATASAYSYNEYGSFHIGNEQEGFALHYGDIGHNVGNGFDRTENLKFSTYDRDNDGLTYNCAEKHRGGWWYGGFDQRNVLDWRDCRRWFDGGSKYRQCTHSNLNGEYNGGDAQNLFWSYSWYCNIKSVEMKVHRLQK